MRKFILAATVLATLAACGGEGDKPKETGFEGAAEVLFWNPDNKKGLELIGKSDFFPCHKIDEAYTGPTYRQVADKYASQAPGIIPQLAEKIIKGGSGVWGQVPMIPHATISEADAEAMVKYILLLKK